MLIKSAKMLMLVFTSLMLISIGNSLAQCTNNCVPLNETFGSTATCGNPQNTTNPAIVNHSLKPYNGGNNDFPDDGEYAIRCNGADVNWGWFGAGGTTISDHTIDAPGQTGNFALINSGTGPREFYHKTVSNLCANTTYNLTYYAGNIVRDNMYGNEPSLQTYLFPGATPVQLCPNKSTGGCVPSGGTLLGSSGGITSPSSATGFVWNSYSYNFTTGAGQTSIDIVLVSLFGSNAGFDFAFDDVTVTWVSGGGVSCTVPVELISFTAKESPERALLKWSTASEENFSYFTIEKSENGINFSEIGKINGKGSVSGLANYEFSDFDFHNVAYYRLKMVDLDASSKYSNVVALVNRTDRYCKVFKNESGELEINVNAPQHSFIKVLVYSVMGQKYAESEIDLSEGANRIVKDFLPRNNSALVRIISSNGEVLFSDIVSLL
jgi:hypothetical protein